MDSTLQPIATFGAAFVTAFVALMVVIITKEQKVSEFRQAWINDLRADLAEAISAGSALTIIIQVLDSDDDKDDLHREWARFVAALARVELRLNLGEKPHQDLEACIRKAEELMRRLEGDSTDYDPAVWIALQDQVMAVARPLLKIEWDRVKAGEPVYRLAKGLLVAAMVVLPMTALLIYICQQH
jgi:hypothetical protein